MTNGYLFHSTLAAPPPQTLSTTRSPLSMPLRLSIPIFCVPRVQLVGLARAHLRSIPSGIQYFLQQTFKGQASVSLSPCGRSLGMWHTPRCSQTYTGSCAQLSLHEHAQRENTWRYGCSSPLPISVNLQMIICARMRSIYPSMQPRLLTCLPSSPIVTLRPP